MLGVIAGIAGNQMQAGHRHIELGATGVLQHKKLAGLALNRYGFEAQIAAHPMVDVNHRCTDPQFRQVPKTCIVGFCGLLPAPSLQYPLAK